MNILVCMKQVPDTTEIKIDPVTNTLIRAGVPSIVNPFDGYALEMALRFKESIGGDATITILSMGPEQAKVAIKECLSVGANKGYLVTDRVFGGSDTLATSYILSCAIEKLGPFDLIFCGKQAIDGDTAQVGPEIAEHLNMPQVTYAVDITKEGDKVHVKRETEEGHDIIECPLPTVITVTKTPYELRYATIKSKIAANKAEIPNVTFADLPKIDATKIGLKGSPTKVKKTFTPPRNKSCKIIREEDAKKAVETLLNDLSEAKIM